MKRVMNDMSEYVGTTFHGSTFNLSFSQYFASDWFINLSLYSRDMGLRWIESGTVWPSTCA
jgi:hypothetical protein